MNTEHAKRVIDFQEVRRVPLTAVLEHLGEFAQLKRQGSSLVGPCPICGGRSRKKFSVSFHKTPQLWRCFDPGHDSGGDALTFVSEYEKVTIGEAGRLIAGWFGIGVRTATSQRKSQTRRRPSMSETTNRPTHKVYSCTPREGQKDWLTEIGAAWPFSTKDNRTGLNITLTALPATTRMVLFEADDEPEQGDKSPAASEKKSNGRRK